MEPEGEQGSYRACVFLDREQWDRCLEDLAVAEAQRKDHPIGMHLREVYLMRGHCYYAKQEWSAARSAYEQYLAQGPEGTPGRERAIGRLEELRGKVDGR